MAEKNTNGTFIIHINHTQNASWQGEITWAEKKITKNFRSTLELIKMIDGVLQYDGEADNGALDEKI